MINFTIAIQQVHNRQLTYGASTVTSNLTAFLLLIGVINLLRLKSVW